MAQPFSKTIVIFIFYSLNLAKIIKVYDNNDMIILNTKLIFRNKPKDS